MSPGARVVPWFAAAAAVWALGPGPASVAADDEIPSTGAGTDEPVVLDEAAPEPAAHAEGEYGGVMPGGGKGDKVNVVSGRPAKRKVPKRPTLTWIGFQPLGAGSSRVFLQLSSSVDYSQKMNAGRDADGNEVSELVVSLPDFRIEKTNDTRPLDSRFFETSVSRVAAKRVGATGRGKKRTPGGVEIRIQFKNAKDARSGDARLEKAADGFHYLYLDFGPPSAG